MDSQHKYQPIMDLVLAHKDIYIGELDNRYTDPETFIVNNYKTITSIHRTDDNRNTIITILGAIRKSGIKLVNGRTGYIAESIYMTNNTEAFMAEVFSDDPRYADACGGMVSAHGDKVTQYMHYWKSKGLLAHKAQIIYFLTYTRLLGDTPKYKSNDWVVDNYNRFAHLLP